MPQVLELKPQKMCDGEIGVIFVKKILVLACALLLLCGCSGEEKEQCYDCGEWITGGITLKHSGTVCGKCFAERGYLVCRNCGDAYDPDDCYVEDFGYCDDCESELVGICGRCDNAYLRDQLGVSDDGEHYLCAVCENKDLKESVEDLKSFIDDPILAKSATDGAQKIYDDAYDDGFDDGYDSGYEEGKEEGYSSGNEAGTKTGHDAGYEEGYKAGHEDGRKEGYNSGYDAGVSIAASVTRSSNDTKPSNSSPSSGSTSSQPQSVTVYITKTGSKYHRSGCQYLSKSKIAISLDDAKSRGYTACSRCW